MAGYDSLCAFIMDLRVVYWLKFEPACISSDDEDVCEGSEHKMRNIAYALSGYDQYFGNPSFTQTGGQLVDPGLRDQIFAAVYDGTLTADNRYCIPGRFEILSTRLSHLWRLPHSVGVNLVHVLWDRTHQDDYNDRAHCQIVSFKWQPACK